MGTNHHYGAGFRFIQASNPENAFFFQFGNHMAIVNQRAASIDRTSRALVFLNRLFRLPQRFPHTETEAGMLCNFDFDLSHFFFKLSR